MFRMGSDGIIRKRRQRGGDGRRIHDRSDGRSPIGNSASSSRRRATLRSRSCARRETHPGALPTCSWPARWCFAAARSRSICATGSQWWQFKYGADWRQPYGPRRADQRARQSSGCSRRVSGCGRLRQWAGKALPTEAEWELRHAADWTSAEYAWGAEFTPDGDEHRANTWQGEFPGTRILPSMASRGLRR